MFLFRLRRRVPGDAHHAAADLVPGRVRLCEFAGDLSPENRQDAVRKAEDLVQVRADEQDGAAGVALLHDLTVDEVGGADVHAARGLRDHHRFRAEGELAGDDHLLHVAAGEGADLRSDARAADIELLRQLSRVPAGRTPAHVDAEEGEGPAPMLADQQVLRDVPLRRDAGRKPVLRHMGQAHLPDLSRRLAPGRFSEDQDLPAADRPHPGDGFRQLALPVALDARDADDLAAAHVEAHAPHLKIPHRDGRDRAVFALQLAQQHVPAHHQRGQLPLVHLRRLIHAHHLSAPHHAHAVGDLHHLAETVGDDDHGHALVPHHAADHVEEFVGLLRRQHGGRLVEDQDVRAAVQGLQDLHALPLRGSSPRTMFCAAEKEGTSIKC